MQAKPILILLAGTALGAAAIQTLNAQSAKSVPAFYIAEHQVHDVQTMGSYSTRVPATLESFGGRFLARGGRVLTLEGDVPKGRMVVIAFDSLEKAKAWYESAAYQEIKPTRLKAAKSHVIVVEGVSN